VSVREGQGEPTRTVILVQSQEAHDAWVALAETLPWARDRHVAFGVLLSEVQAGVADQRERSPRCPLGFIALTEPDVLAALAGGADDAMVLATRDPASLAAFVDRVELRARIRADTQRLKETFVHAERLTALGMLVAGVGHEINNPLSALLMSLDVARRRMFPWLLAASEIARAVESGQPIPPAAIVGLGDSAWSDAERQKGAALFEDMTGAAETIATIVRDLRTLARSDRLDESPELVEVPELVEHAVRLSGREVERRGILDRDYAVALPPLLVPRGRVTQVVMNILINALDAIAEIERANHRVRISARADDEFVVIAVEDTGPGIPPEALRRIFDPFYTTKRQSLGTGLGLSISRDILRRLGGELTVESVHGEGATFLCFLPLPAPDALSRAQRPAPLAIVQQAPLATRTILVVDDDEGVVRSYRRLLGAQHRLMTARDGREAIEVLQSGPAPDVLVVELDLQGTDGRQLVAWLASHRPDLVARTILATSSGVHASYDDFLNAYAGVVVHKPVRGRELLAAIEAVTTG